MWSDVWLHVHVHVAKHPSHADAQSESLKKQPEPGFPAAAPDCKSNLQKAKVVSLKGRVQFHTAVLLGLTPARLLSFKIIRRLVRPRSNPLSVSEAGKHHPIIKALRSHGNSSGHGNRSKNHHFCSQRIFFSSVSLQHLSCYNPAFLFVTQLTRNTAQ